VAWQYALLLIDKLIGHNVPVRFALFALIGGLGLIAHLFVHGTGIAIGLNFAAAQSIATIVATDLKSFTEQLIHLS
jgi:dolichol-phosphate mannosyltransferase